MPITPLFLLAAVDLKRTADGRITGAPREEAIDHGHFPGRSPRPVRSPAMKPKVILFDEPTGAPDLDPVGTGALPGAVALCQAGVSSSRRRPP